MTECVNAFLFQIFINNEWVNSKGGRVFPTINPCNGKKICDVQEGDKVLSSFFTGRMTQGILLLWKM